ncbi:MAG: serine hydrolase [Bacteroidota bacterium]
MKKLIYLLTILIFPSLLAAQNYYFPPNDDDTWETITPTDAGICSDELDGLYTYLEEKNTKAFIVLKDGKIAIEQYFDGFGKDSIWYWASAGKTVTGLLVGIAQEEGLLDIDDKTSDYLGAGWTSLTTEKENLITIRHQLAMTTGLDDDVADADCLEPACLNYLTDPEDRWSYYNAPYRLLQDVIENASGQNLNVYTYLKLMNKIGAGGAWFNRIFFSTPRDMARFGSLIINQGTWDGTPVLSDQNFINEMINTANSHNLSYGYLWWLNGKGTYMLPQTQFVFNNDLVPNAPDDLYAALGKNDQKLYIVPSQNLVVVRMGDDAGNIQLALSSFDNELWGILSDVLCESTTSTETLPSNRLKIYPNPVGDVLLFDGTHDLENTNVRIFNTLGQEVINAPITNGQLDVSDLAKGNYIIQFLRVGENSWQTAKFTKM